ncbi:class I SAM-dependent methyltransferase [Streptomyces sp. WMMB303]|uniref:class I SAM-dependent methyltransferase n=1 Tax=Streptomyces sp. WMMB303 TaxID=3034154 RepID=UPI0023ED4DBF|nr:class I SAM-dependent methyltransferase [Streptomyces sp. WMMB303]MDF4248944.1 class I SAM-dependent methyltransferase [Streptomyces sp. WMMB303]
MTIDVSPESAAFGFEGQPYYEHRRLRLYDAVVVHASNRVLWRCPKDRLLDHYNEWITSRHLEVGPGSGYYLDHCRFPPGGDPELTLLDLNPDPLRFAAHRLRRYTPRCVQADLLEPLSGLGAGKFTSIACNYVLHCLPRPPGGKQLVLKHLSRELAPDGVLFGSTVLSGGVRHTALSRRFNLLYQRQGSFHNQHDSVRWLHRALEENFTSHWIEVRGSVALFAARAPADSARAGAEAPADLPPERPGV